MTSQTDLKRLNSGLFILMLFYFQCTSFLIYLEYCLLFVSVLPLIDFNSLSCFLGSARDTLRPTPPLWSHSSSCSSSLFSFVQVQPSNTSARSTPPTPGSCPGLLCCPTWSPCGNLWTLAGPWSAGEVMPVVPPLTNRGQRSMDKCFPLQIPKWDSEAPPRSCQTEQQSDGEGPTESALALALLPAPCQAAFHSAPGLHSQMNHLHTNLCPLFCFWGKLDYKGFFVLLRGHGLFIYFHTFLIWQLKPIQP